MPIASLGRAGALVAFIAAAGAAFAQGEEAGPAAPAAKEGIVATFISNWRWVDRAPEFEMGDWRFKLRGRLMYDLGYTSNPGLAPADGNLGFDGRVRRARIGADGNLPGNFAYKGELDFSTHEAVWADIYLEWKPASRWTLRVGNQNSFQSLEQPTSSLDINFMERPQFVEAYGQGRRLGAAVAYSSDSLFIGTGLFAQSINSLHDYAGWLFGARVVVMPDVAGVMLHLGANYQHRVDRESGVSYRAGPNPRLTDIRFVDTGPIAVQSEDQLGLEALAIRGPLHVVAEASWLRPRASNPAQGDGIAAGDIVPAGNPGFFGYYLEAGYFFTGESRGYKKASAVWGPTPVKRPVGKGGYGSLSGNLRWDMIDLLDKALLSGGVNTSPSRGGRSRQMSVSLIWQPIDHVRLTTQYTRSKIRGGPYALEANGLSSGNATDYRYALDIVGARFAYDF